MYASYPGTGFRISQRLLECLFYACMLVNTAGDAGRLAETPAYHLCRY